MILDTRTLKKIKYFSYMSNSMIFGSHFENMKIKPLRRHFSACQHWFSDSAYQITPIKVSNPFLHKMPVLVNFSDFFPDYSIVLLSFASFSYISL